MDIVFGPWEERTKYVTISEKVFQLFLLISIFSKGFEITNKISVL